MVDGLLNLTPWTCVGVTIALTHITVASVTIFLHRSQAHNALTLHPSVSHFFRFWLWMTTGMVTKEWVAVHRKHHAKCETIDDPHSPQVLGIWNVLLGGAQLYRAAVQNAGTVEQYGNGTPDDWLERRVYERFRYLGISIMAVVDVLLFGAFGLVVFAVQMIWIPVWAAGVINGLGHFLGYRNFETTDASRNLLPFGFLMGGEELHNNHHAYPQSAKLSNKWWELDIGWLYIKTLSLLGLATVRRLAPRVIIVRSKHAVDLETLRAVARDRYHILKLYGRKVVRPAVRVECRASNGSARALLRRARKLMTREDVNLDVDAQAALNSALQHSQSLKTIYRFKARLKASWTRTPNDVASRVERLSIWCAEAELSGIKGLKEFAGVLRGYSLKSRLDQSAQA
jgi:stearoyl-CoA desaturase (delta-9 desaturase)